MKVSILSTGSYLPRQVVKNEDLSQFPPASLSLIAAKTGVLARHRCSDEKSTSDLAIRAATGCLEKIGFPSESVDAVVVATSTPDRLIPATATKVAASIGANRAFAFDINSVCSGSLALLELGRAMIRGGTAKNVLVVAADTYSKFLNPMDFSTFPYFGDGAGAAILSADGTGPEVLEGILHSDGTGYEAVTIKGGGSELPPQLVSDKRDFYFKMNGRAIFEFATKRGVEVINEVLTRHSIRLDEVASFILHQANINILKNIAHSLGIEEERFFSNLQRVGNTAGASTLIALDEWLCTGAKNPGKYAILASFGGGLTWGAMAIQLL
jgi:3-oxoacyl-[acyl-carrier-protein] synthase-3